MNTVLKMECGRYNNILLLMAATLKEFRKAVKGLVVMSSDLEGLGNDMYINIVPGLWESKSFLSMKPLSSWVNDLNDRIHFLDDWYKRGTGGVGGSPPVYWFSGFFFPQAFLTGALQNF